MYDHTKTKDLLLYLYEKLDENNSYQQVQTAVQQYIHTVHNVIYLFVASNSVLVADDDTTSAVSPTKTGAPRRDA